MNDIIKIFPKEVDRHYFGAWLSGFTDGEGCFRLDVSKTPAGNYTPKATFHIGLRGDDSEILYLIQSYFSCGSIIHNAGNRKAANLQTRYSVRVISELRRIVIPHFDRYNLLAKKKEDYLIWRRGVEIISDIISQPMRNNRRGRGRLPRWNDQNMSEFCDLVVSLKEQRLYRGPVE